MPFKLEVFHPDRIVVGIGRGEITMADLLAFRDELLATGTLHCRKIIDIAGATSALRKKDLAAFATPLREHLAARPSARPSGAIAIVADHRRSELALLFVQMTGGERPAKVFRSIHDVRNWLHENSKIIL